MLDARLKMRATAWRTTKKASVKLLRRLKARYLRTIYRLRRGLQFHEESPCRLGNEQGAKARPLAGEVQAFRGKTKQFPNRYRGQGKRCCRTSCLRETSCFSKNNCYFGYQGTDLTFVRVSGNG